VLLFASNQRLVVPAIWRAIDELGDDDLADKIRKRVSHLLAEHYSAKITAKRPSERLRQFFDLLTAEGGLIEIVEGDRGQLVPPQAELPFYQHGRPTAKRLPHRPGHDERRRRAAGASDGLPPRRRPVLHVRDRWRERMKAEG